MSQMHQLANAGTAVLYTSVKDLAIEKTHTQCGNSVSYTDVVTVRMNIRRVGLITVHRQDQLSLATGHPPVSRCSEHGQWPGHAYTSREETSSSMTQ